MAPLSGVLVVDLSWYLPGPFASRELSRRGARVVRLEPPAGDPLRQFAPAWHDALNAGKESVVCDLKADPGFGRALCSRADVVLESFRPGVADGLGVGFDQLPDSVVYCSFSGFGTAGPHARRAGHDLNYQGYAGLLADTAPAVPPAQIADLAAGSLTAVAEILAALLERARTGRGGRVEVSLTHAAHGLVAHRLGGEPVPRLLTGGLACYRMYGTADRRYLTVAALEPRAFRSLCELLALPELVERQYEHASQHELGRVLGDTFSTRPLGAWLELFEGEDVFVGPVATLDEAREDFGAVGVDAGSPTAGEHTARWRTELGLD